MEQKLNQQEILSRDTLAALKQITVADPKQQELLNKALAGVQEWANFVAECRKCKCEKGEDCRRAALFARQDKLLQTISLIDERAQALCAKCGVPCEDSRTKSLFDRQENILKTLTGFQARIAKLTEVVGGRAAPCAVSIAAAAAPEDEARRASLFARQEGVLNTLKAIEQRVSKLLDSFAAKQQAAAPAAAAPAESDEPKRKALYARQEVALKAITTLDAKVSALLSFLEAKAPSPTGSPPPSPTVHIAPPSPVAPLPPAEKKEEDPRTAALFARQEAVLQAAQSLDSRLGTILAQLDKKTPVCVPCLKGPCEKVVAPPCPTPSVQEQLTKGPMFNLFKGMVKHSKQPKRVLFPTDDGFCSFYPSAVVLVTSLDKQRNKVAVATVSRWTVVNDAPLMFGIALAQRPATEPHVSVSPTFTSSVIAQSGEFVINVLHTGLKQAWEKVAAISNTTHPDVDKLKEAGLTAIAGSKVASPLVAECPINIECVVQQKVYLPTHDFIIATPVAYHTVFESNNVEWNQAITLPADV